MSEEKDKVVQFEDYRELTIPTDEDTKKKKDKERKM